MTRYDPADPSFVVYGALAIGLLLIVLAICWLIVPLILLRQNNHLKRILAELQLANSLRREAALHRPGLAGTPHKSTSSLRPGTSS